MDTKPLTIDGFLYAVPTPGTCPGTARFEVISSPTDDPEDDTVFSCTTEEPRIAYALLTEIQPGDLLHLSGTLVQPSDTGEAAQLTVDALEVLATAPARALQEMVLDRYGDYVVVFDADTDAVPVFTALGQWVGIAENPDAIGTLIEIHESGNGGDA
ncbi:MULTISPECIES: hypothetical protein [Streptomyces]|uniref:DUF4265 domain-containing protein n=1 Tax=Streptomyces dengpaensis TaxID=2049881 RepID=A0ABM6T4B6_9ACTN|nr:MULTISPECIES: hypothetical protein [Streptomyces]AVH61736.1 hypothetical protein C4B68_40220 [Streptomyces dengpaensis]PIB05054.1 hypothetical protein B1C81_30565 [Streptomyces sp. HG99]